MAEGRGLEPRSVMSAGSLAGCFLVQSDAFRVKESGSPFLIQNWWARWESNPQAAGSEPTRYASSLHLPVRWWRRLESNQPSRNDCSTDSPVSITVYASKMVGTRGIEPPRISPQAPRACASAVPPRAEVWWTRRDSNPHPARFKLACSAVRHRSTMVAALGVEPRSPKV